MAIVINEFEVVPGESSARESGPTTIGGSEAPAPSARDIVCLVEQQLQREERVWAH